MSYAIILLLVSPLHNIFSEWGGVMQYFAGKEILSGAGYQGWTSHFWPPLFSFLIGLGSKFMDGFQAGKLISVISGSILLYIAYQLAMELSGHKEIGLWAQVFVALSPIYFHESLQAHNHMLDALFAVTCIYLYIKSVREPRPWTMVIAGIVCGLAGLSRFQSYALLALPLLSYLFLHNFVTATKLAIAFWLGFALVSFPWFYYNTVINGSPLYNWEHLNVCSAVIPGLSYGSFSSLQWCRSQANLNGLFDILAEYPLDYIRNFVHNIGASAKLLVRYGGVLAPFVIPAIFDSFLFTKFRIWIILFGELSLFILLVSQASVLPWFLLSWIVLITIISTIFLLKYLTSVQHKFSLLEKFQFRKLSLALLIMAGSVLVTFQLISYVHQQNSIAALADLEQVTRALKEYDPHLESKTIMAINPARAYYAGSKFLMTPAYSEGSLDSLVSYGGLSDRVRTYAPKYPSSMPISDMKADYFVYTRPLYNYIEEEDSPDLAYLLDPASDQIPENFRLVYNSVDVAVYEIIWK
jgi:hypothetical protein